MIFAALISMPKSRDAEKYSKYNGCNFVRGVIPITAGFYIVRKVNERLKTLNDMRSL
jgi:hypothetical protein